MKSYRPIIIKKDAILIIVVLIIFSALAAFIAVKNIKISPDSMRFGLVSQEILSGNGIRLPIIRLEDNYTPVHGAIPFLDQMPLLSILFAIMGGVTAQNFLPSQIINFISHVTMTIITYLLMKNLYDKKVVALLTGILVSFSYPLLWTTHHMLSEPLFIALTLATVFFLTLSRNSNYDKFNRNFIAASICASAAILTRNAGVALIPLFFWEAFILVKNKSMKSIYVSTALAITLPLITTLTMFARNYVISGTFRGFVASSPDRSYLEALTGTVEMIFQQFQLGKNAIMLITSFMMLCVLYILINANSRRETLKFFNAGLDSVVIFIVSSSVLVCLTMAKHQWNFELRYMSPLVPFLYISGIFLTVFVWDRIRLIRFSYLSTAGMILFLGIISSGTLYKTYINFSEFSYKQENAYSILHSCIYHWIKENYHDNIIIATNKPYHLSFFGEYSTIALPHKKFNPTIHVPEDMESVLPSRMSNFGARIIALFEDAEEQYYGSYISGLFNKRESNDKFILAHECPDGVAYYLKE